MGSTFNEWSVRRKMWGHKIQVDVMFKSCLVCDLLPEPFETCVATFFFKVVVLLFEAVVSPHVGSFFWVEVFLFRFFLFRYLQQLAYTDCQKNTVWGRALGLFQ